MAVNTKKLVETTTGPLGTGGVDYNTADAAAKKRLAQLRVQRQNDPNFNTNETQRALSVYQNRLNAGLDTSAQSKYLTSNLGYTGALPTATQGSVAAPKPTYTQEAQSLYDMMKNRATQPVKEFSYDPQSDPAYQSALKRAQANIEQGNSAAQAEMNRRGILNSTITSDRMGEISANEMGRVETEVVPQLMQAAYQRYADQLAQEQQQFANAGALAGMFTGEDQRQFGNRVTEADLTGNYMPAGAQDIVNNILQLKEMAETKGISAADRAQLSARADGMRAQLLSMGVDTSQLGANVKSTSARQANIGVRTLAGQQADMQRQAANWNAAQSVWDASGRLVNPQSDWSGLLRQAQNEKAPLTMAAQQQNFQNQQVLEQFAYQKARDSIGDVQWKAQFDENTRQFGLSYALDQLRESNQTAYQNAQIAMGQDDNARLWAQLDAELSRSTGGTAEYNGMSANQVYDAVRSRFMKTDNKSGKEYIPTDAGTKQKIYESVGGMGLPQGQDEQVMMMLGLTAADIKKYDKQYGYDAGK